MRKKKEKENVSKKMKQLKVISSSFDCSGSFELIKPFVINLMPKNNNLLLHFPHPSQNQIQKAIQCAKKSGFGKELSNVVDQSYRFAFQYLPDELGLPSPLIQRIYSDVLEVIRNSLGCDTKIKAELIKINIYPKGGLFKKHVDSPKGDAFGSLVVFLPSYYRGGKLIVQNKQTLHQFDYSGNKNENKINWTAFYNDCVHEITQVLQGCRITLSYNLFYESLVQVNVKPKKQYIDFLKQLPRNKCYGFYCEHYYGINALKNSNKEMKNRRFLKGKDYDIYIAANQIKPKKVCLKILIDQSIKRPAQFQQCDPLDISSQSSQSPQSKQQQVPSRPGIRNFAEQYEQEQNVKFFGDPKNITQTKIAWQQYEGEDQGMKAHFFKMLNLKRWKDFHKVQWLNQQNDKSNYRYAISTYYGNDYSVGQHYCQLLILIFL